MFAVYWQPGCTSCLKAKEFLARHGIDYESINVRASPDAPARLAALGARSIPVIARGDDWVYGQDLDDLARFLGLDDERARLAPPALADRLERLLAAASRYTAQLPDGVLETLLPGRADRAGADLAYHVPMIVAGFLAAAAGGCLNFEYFERRPSGTDRLRPALVAAQRAVALRFADWWRASAAALPAEVDTYYGRRALATVLERTAWHVAQHARQLESLVRGTGQAPDGALGSAELDGLPLPEGLWDPEIGATR
jgi:glutaredoxin